MKKSEQSIEIQVNSVILRERMARDMSIPLVDLSLPEDEIALSMKRACETFGFFYLSNHGVPKEIVDDLFHGMHQFFGLNAELKRTVLQNEHNRGYTPLGEETLDPAKQKSGDTKEGYYIGRHVPLDHPDPRERGPLRAPDVWPDEQLLGIPGWKTKMQSYYDQMIHLSHRLMRPFAQALGLPSDFFESKFDRPTALMRPLHYAACRSQPEDGIFAAGAHSDYGVLTILCTDQIPGLQILTNEGQWVPVEPIEGFFVVNVGDLCEIWTNGQFRSTVHRVVTSGESDRYSCAFFWEPNFDCLITPLEQCITRERPVAYSPIVYGDYILSKYKATHAGYGNQS